MEEGELKKRIFNLALITDDCSFKDVWMDGNTFFQIRNIIDEAKKEFPKVSEEIIRLVETEECPTADELLKVLGAILDLIQETKTWKKKWFGDSV